MISQAEIAIFRSLKKTAIILLLMFRLDKPIGRDEIAQILDIDPRTVRNHLNSLLHFGLITRTHYQNGYTLSQFGRQMILGQNIQDLAHLPVALPKQVPPEALPEQIQVLLEAHEAHEPAQALQTDDLPDPKIKKGTICADTQFVLKEEEVNQFTINLNTSSSDLIKDCQISMKKLLEASSILFGEPGVIMDYLPEIKSKVVLGWLAHAYQQRHRLRSPAGLVYSQLKKGNLPGENYLSHPETYLPFDYLLAIGYRIEIEKEPNIEELNNEEPIEIHIDDPNLDEPIHGKITARQAWKSTLDQLKIEMSKPIFDLWLANTRVIAWSDNCLTIGVENAFAYDWLTDRLTNKVTRLLTGILNQKIDVRFMIDQ